MPDEVLPAEVDDNQRVLELRAQWSIPGRASGESRWRFIMLKTGLFDQQLALWEKWRDELKVFWTNGRAGGWTFEQVIVKDLWPATLPDLVVPVGEVDGGDPGDQGPPQATPIITWRSDFIGRSYRGRTFWGPIRWTDMDEGQYDELIRSILDNFAFSMLDQFGTGDLIATDPHFIIFSRQHNGIPEASGRYAPVTSYSIPRYLATQRRRQRYYHP